VENGWREDCCHVPLLQMAALPYKGEKSMAIRVFSDPDGREWQVWDVVPNRELEPGSRRRHYLPPEMAEGWLCFEAADQKRRLTPFPADWEQKDDDFMNLLCRSAEVVTPRAPQGTGADGAQRVGEEVAEAA
jgi:hypothetical protein